jgi:hypothetical protein
MEPQPSRDLVKTNWFSRHPAWTIGGALAGGLLLLICFGAAIFALVFGIMKSSTPYRMALEQARQSTAVAQQIGDPIHAGWFVTGNVQVDGPSGHSEMQIPITGPKGKATLYFVAGKKLGQWTFTALQVEFASTGSRINLLAAAPDSGGPAR